MGLLLLCCHDYFPCYFTILKDGCRGSKVQVSWMGLVCKIWAIDGRIEGPVVVCDKVFA